jgi:hypothetical protein
MASYRSIMVLACTAGAIGCVATTGTLAADLVALTHAASYCQPRAATDHVEYTNYGPKNVGTKVATVECPFLLSNTGGARGGTVDNISMIVYDRNPTLNVNCRLQGIQYTGDILWEVSLSSSGSGPASQLLHATIGKGASLLHMSCSLPPNVGSGYSHITSYILAVELL